MRHLHFYIISAFIIVLTMSSCFQNTDFDQGDDFVLKPVVELDLIYFDINASQFFDDASNTPNLIVRDTTGFEVIEGSDTRDILVRADFLYKFTNKIPSDFSVNLDFLDDSNTVRYATSTTVLAGNADTPVETIFIDVLNQDQIADITFSNKVLVSVTIPSSNATLSGNLNLQSKVTYFLEID